MQGSADRIVELTNSALRLEREQEHSNINSTVFEFLKEFYCMSNNDVDDFLPCLEQKCEVKIEPEFHLNEP